MSFQQKTPAISVIMPVYNAALHLAQCLDSLTEQSFRDFEILTIDDGSEDNSLQILRQYAAKDSRIKIIESTHNGAGTSRNIGIAHACGEYLSFLDADDNFDSNMLEKAYDAAKKNNSDVLCFQYRELNIITGDIKHHRSAYILSAKHQNKFHPNITRACKVSPCPWNKLFRTAFIKKHGLTFQNLTSCNDFLFSKSATLLAERVYFLAEDLLTYRRHQLSLSATRYKNMMNIIEAGKAFRLVIESNFPGKNMSPFYRMMLFHYAHEFRQLPSGNNAYAYISKVLEELPLWHGIQFIKKIVYFRVRECIRHFFRTVKEKFVS